ncbi:MAG TPA: YgcG family protein [Steroidobacteraceae bacterium]|nr:YgcG family protein [Steroidobacteraceae bacterium]
MKGGALARGAARTLRAALFGCCLLGFAARGAWSQDLQPVPKLEARVTDQTGTLTAEQQSALEEKLTTFEGRKGSQIAVLIVATTKPEEIEQYSIRAVEAWKLGRKAVDDGALLLIAKDDRTMRIEVGKGLEGALTDATSSRIIAETIAPLFRQGDFYGGINAGLDQMIRVVDGEPLPPPDRRWEDRARRDTPHVIPILFFAVVFGSTILRALFGRSLGALITGAAAGALVWFAMQAVFMAIAVGAGAFFFSLIFGSSVGRGWSSYPRSGGWGGGGFGGGLGGGLGGGGFGGGGGGFSGGGASGRW